MEGRERKRYPPHPLSTLELQKRATGILRLPGERIMHLAEELYQAGFVSYPRTETDAFDPQMDLVVGTADRHAEPESHAGLQGFDSSVCDNATPQSHAGAA